MFADTYGKLHLLRRRPNGWSSNGRSRISARKSGSSSSGTSTGTASRRSSSPTVDGRILVYSMETYQNIWQNLEDNFSSIEAIEVANVDDDRSWNWCTSRGTPCISWTGKQDRQWVSQQPSRERKSSWGTSTRTRRWRSFSTAGHYRFALLTTSKSRGPAVRRPDRPVRHEQRGIPRSSGNFSDYSLRVYDVYARRELW